MTNSARRQNYGRLRRTFSRGFQPDAQPTQAHPARKLLSDASAHLPTYKYASRAACLRHT